MKGAFDYVVKGRLLQTTDPLALYKAFLAG